MSLGQIFVLPAVIEVNILSTFWIFQSWFRQTRVGKDWDVFFSRKLRKFVFSGNGCPVKMIITVTKPKPIMFPSLYLTGRVVIDPRQ